MESLMGEKGLTHMDTGVTDAVRPGKRRSGNWLGDLTTQRSSFVTAKDRLERARKSMRRGEGPEGSPAGRGKQKGWKGGGTQSGFAPGGRSSSRLLAGWEGASFEGGL